jgi:FtsP/CotA-like multicopper oxidase with cupredoxin domain
MHLGKERQHMRGLNHDHEGDKAMSPGPTLRVEQGSEVTVDFTNGTDLETTAHWHGLRLDNRFDGVSEGASHHGMQPPITPAGSFSYRLRFPDPGVYWYHQHRSVK